MKYIFTSLLILLLPRLACCQAYKQYLQLSYEEIDSLMRMKSDSAAYDDAFLYMQAGREKAKREFGEMDTTFADFCVWGGFLYKKKGAFDKAEALYIQANNIREKVLGRGHPDFAYSTNALAILYNDNKRYTEALPLFIQANNSYEKAYGKDHTDFIISLNNIGLCNYRMGNYDKALSIFIEVKERRKKVQGAEHPNFVQSLSDVAFLYETMGDNDKALSFYIQIKDIRERTVGKEDPSYGDALNRIALLYQQMGDYEKAVPLYTQVIDIWKKALDPEDPKIATGFNNLAVLYYYMGNYELALSLFIDAKNIREKTLGKEHSDFASSLDNISAVHLETESYELALPLAIQAKDIREKALGKDHASYASSLDRIASIYQAMGEYDKALPLFIDAKNIRGKTLGKEHPTFAVALNNLALLYYDMQRYERALPLYMEAKDIKEKVLGSEHNEFAATLSNIALLHKKMKNYELALPLFIQVKNIQEKKLGRAHTDYANSLNNIGHSYEGLGNYELAWDFFSQAINSSTTRNIPATFDKAWFDSISLAPYPSNRHLNNTMISLARIYSTLEKDSSISDLTQKQILVTDLAAALLARARNQISSEKDKLRMLSKSNTWLKYSLEVLNPEEHAPKAFDLADKNKSALLLDATKSEKAYSLGDLPDSLVIKDKKLLKRHSLLQAKLYEKRTKEEKDSLRNELNQVNQDIEDFINMIKEKYPKYHKLKYQQIDAKVADIQALLDDNTVLLEYVIADSVIHIFCIDKAQIQWKKSFVGNKALKSRIKNLHDALSNYKAVVEKTENSYNAYTKDAYWFYQKLLAPVLEGKQNIKNLIIVTDGELGHLPFETFLVEKAPNQTTDYRQLHYLVSDYNISYNYSATLWKENIEAPLPKNNGQIFAVAANYNMKLDSALMDIRLPTHQWLRDELKPLPAAREEVAALSKAFKGFFGFDEMASEKIVKGKIENYAVLHFAVHGFPDKTRPALSWLALSEDNDSTESNFLQAHEISKMELNADLVVLSACETGYGKFEKGNGIASLARAFMYAGSPAMVVSLWQVNDNATSLIMNNFYHSLADGMPKDKALRQAKLDYMKTAKGIMAHPAFWSPFIMIGNTSPIKLQKKGNAMVWGIGLGVLALLAIGGGFALRRRKKEVSA